MLDALATVDPDPDLADLPADVLSMRFPAGLRRAAQAEVERSTEVHAAAVEADMDLLGGGGRVQRARGEKDHEKQVSHHDGGPGANRVPPSRRR